ncbi:MAG: glycosidase [Actinomycetia bacterium]|nr:glycosidase [Actinomycetes bacterium]
MTEDPSAWWRNGVLYQLYPRSFADSNGDGVGDLVGITQHLDHMQWLGVRGFWSSPITPSANFDWGYDVKDYTSVDADLGTLEDAESMITAATARGLKVILDLVPNHTSTEHPWFLESRSSRDNPKRDWYVWEDAKPDGSLPNNWQSSFIGPAWRLDELTGQYYMSNFLRQQADLNWWNQEVRDEFERILRFWFDRGVAGFRIDVAHMLIKDRELRDNPPATEDDQLVEQLRGQRQQYNSNRPEVHEIYRRWREIADSYDPPRLLLGETPVWKPSILASYYGEGDELDLAFNFILLESPFEADAMHQVIETTLAALPRGCQAVWAGGNHDVPRFATRWGGNSPARARAAMLMLMTLPGTPFLFAGDEILMQDTALTQEQLRDPLGVKLYPMPVGRDPERTPMQWSGEPGAGFTEPGVEPWLPFGDLSVNVADQRDDPHSALSLTRDLIALRSELPDLHLGGYSRFDGPEGWWCYRRGEQALIAINLSEVHGVLEAVSGQVRIGTQRSRDGEALVGKLALEPDEAVIVRLEL